MEAKEDEKEKNDVKHFKLNLFNEFASIFPLPDSLNFDLIYSACNIRSIHFIFTIKYIGKNHDYA